MSCTNGTTVDKVCSTIHVPMFMSIDYTAGRQPKCLRCSVPPASVYSHKLAQQFWTHTAVTATPHTVSLWAAQTQARTQRSSSLSDESRLTACESVTSASLRSQALPPLGDAYMKPQRICDLGAAMPTFAYPSFCERFSPSNLCFVVALT